MRTLTQLIGLLMLIAACSQTRPQSGQLDNPTATTMLGAASAIEDPVEPTADLSTIPIPSVTPPPPTPQVTVTEEVTRSPASIPPTGSIQASLTDTQVMFRGDAQHTNFYEATGVANPSQLQTLRLEGELIVGNPVLADGVLYVHRIQSLVAFDLQKNAVRWQYRTDSISDFSTTPAVYGDGIFFRHGSRLFSLNRADGELRWQFQLGNSSVGLGEISTPIVADGSVFVEGVQGMYALDTQTGDVKWLFEYEDYRGTSPAFGNDLVYFTAKNSTEYYLYAVRADTGQGLWKFQVENAACAPTPPVISEGFVYITVALRDGSALALGIDTKTGRQQWQYELQRNSDCGAAPAAAGNGLLYIPDARGLVALEAKTGLEKWTTPGSLRTLDVTAAALTADGVFVVGSADATEGASAARAVWVFDEQTGQELWHTDVAGGVNSDIVIGDGKLFFVTGTLNAAETIGVIAQQGAEVPSADASISDGAGISERSGSFTLPSQPGWSASIAVSPDDRFLVSAGGSTLRLWQLNDSTLVWERSIPDPELVGEVGYSQDSETIIATLSSSQEPFNSVGFWRAEDGTLIDKVSGAIAMSPDKELMVHEGDAGSRSRRDASVRNVTTGENLFDLTPPPNIRADLDALTDVVFSPNGTTIATRWEDGTLRLWRSSDGTLLHTFDELQIDAFIFSPDSELIAANTGDGVQIWRVSDAELLPPLAGLTTWPAAFSPDSPLIATSLEDCTGINVWGVSDGELVQDLNFRNENCASALAFSSDSRWLAAAVGEIVLSPLVK